MRAVAQAHRARSARDFLHGDSVGEVTQARAAIIRAHRHSQQPQLAAFAPQVAGEDIAAIDLVGARRNTLFGETLHLLAHRVDDFAEPEIEFAVSRISHSPTPHCHRTPNRWIIGLSDNSATLEARSQWPRSS